MPYVKIIARENGENSKIVVTNYALPGFKPDIGIDVFKQKPDGVNWDLCTQSHEERKSAMAMSVEDYGKNGRHPMFYEVKTGELLKAQVEAKRFGYNNPYIETTLHFTNLDGQDVTIPVMVNTGTGMIDVREPNEKMQQQANSQDSGQVIQYLQFGKEKLKVESNSHNQSRVIDLPNLQGLVTSHQLNVERNANVTSHSPS